jgi:hypothetical protein
MPPDSDHPDSYAEERRRQREYHLERAAGSHAGRRVLLAALLAVSLFLAVSALSFRQATSSGSARTILGNGIAEITDIDRLIAQDLNAPSTGDVPPLPGFPIDIQLTHTEIQGKSVPEVRELVLTRAAARVYDDGVHAFDRTGDQAVSRFSDDGLLTTLANQLTRSNHNRATVALIILAIITALAAGALIISAEEGRRLRFLGGSVLAGALPGVALSAAAWLIVGSIGGNDSFHDALRSLARSVIDVPLRDFLIVMLLGLFILLIGPLMRLGQRQPAHEEGQATSRYEPAGDDYADDDDGYIDDEDYAEEDAIVGDDYFDDDYRDDDDLIGDGDYAQREPRI